MLTTSRSPRVWIGLLSLSLAVNACSNPKATSASPSLNSSLKATPVEVGEETAKEGAVETALLALTQPTASEVAQSSASTETTPIPAAPEPGRAAAVVLAEAIALPSGLSPQQWQSLDALTIPIILPSPVPSGFEPVEVKATPAFSNSRRGGLRYSVRYQNGSRCFVVRAGNGGFGGPVPEQSRAVSSALFPAVDGRDYQLYWTNGNGDGPFPGPTLFTDWMEGTESFYSLMSGDSAGADCDRISPDLAQQLVSSMAEVAPGSSTAGRPIPSSPTAQDEAASATFDPYSMVGLEMLEAMRRLQQNGFRPVSFDEGKVRMTKGSMDAVLMLDASSQRVVEVYTGESAATMCDPATEQC